MLSNASFLAKFRFVTAENEPAKNLRKFANFSNLLTLTPNPKVHPRCVRSRREAREAAVAAAPEEHPRPRRWVREPELEEPEERRREVGLGI